MDEILLEVRDLQTTFTTETGSFSAIEGISFKLARGETLGIVGESGCGKSVTALSILGLIPDPPGRITEGKVLFEGQDLVGKSSRYMRNIRGNRISMIFQEPMTSLNPLFTCGEQIAEVLRIHRRLSVDQARQKAVEMLELVGIPIPDKRVDEYPHQLSGGMRQRVMIAIALACSPALLIADEPTTALDVSIQAQIMGLMKELKERIDASIMLITHDLGVVADIADRIIVMYAGQIIEEGPVRNIFRNPLHPYTRGLMRCIPRIDADQQELQPIPGTVPNLWSMPPGCRFAPRCSFCRDICLTGKPELTRTDSSAVRCFMHQPDKRDAWREER